MSALSRVLVIASQYVRSLSVGLFMAEAGTHVDDDPAEMIRKCTFLNRYENALCCTTRKVHGIFERIGKPSDCLSKDEIDYAGC